MPSVGKYLREGRDALGVSLEEISARTRISVRQLDALETDRLERLPGGVFNISFARQYARELGLDEDEAASRIKDAMGVPGQPQDRILAATEQYSSDGPTSKLAEWASEFFRKHGGSVASLLIGAAMIGGGLYWYDFDQPNQQRQEASVQPTPAQPPASAPQPAPVAVAHEPAAPIELKLEVIETVWVRAVVDGKRLFEETLSSGIVKPIHAQEQVELKVGNAGGVLLSLNGRDLPALGPRGYVRSVTVTPQGMEFEDGSDRPRQSGAPSQEPQATVALRAAELAWTTTIR